MSSRITNTKRTEKEALYGISTGRNRYDTNWTPRELTWRELVNMLSTPKETPETVEEYNLMSREERADVKDVGGFVGGVVRGGRRIRGSVPVRQLLTLDLDAAKSPFDAMAYILSDRWQFDFFIHTTRSYTETSPRYRVLIPLSRPVDPTEYEAVGRYVAHLHDIEQFDPTTYDPARLMYFPSISKGGYFKCKEVAVGKPLDVQEALATYRNHRDPFEWCYGTSDSPKARREINEAEDPMTKQGLVGAFCRTHGMQELLETTLAAYYEPAGGNRYTYIGSSTKGGVVVYDDRFIYSHHATDPNHGQLLNAFDLCRVILFGAEDAGRRTGARTETFPSFKAMLRYCGNDPRTQRALLAEQLQAFDDYSRGGAPKETSEAEQPRTEEGKELTDDEKKTIELLCALTRNKGGRVEETLNNYLLIMEKDPKVAPHIRHDVFTGRTVVTGSLPWGRFDTPYWTDSDAAAWRIYIEAVYGINKKGLYEDGFQALMQNAKVKTDSGLEFMRRAEWDGTPRAETVFIDTLGVADNELNRAQTLLWLKAVYARQVNPGEKFDNMLILSGEEGIGKSTVFSLLGGKVFFSDSFSFEWGDAQKVEAMEGYLIIESAELDGMNRKEVENIKAFLSRREDKYRRPYSRFASILPRRCVFSGTTNEKEILKSKTGNRRMWVMVCNKERIKSTVWDLLTADYVAQIWAEVRALYVQDASLVLPRHLIALQREVQEEYMEENPELSDIETYLRIPVPKIWYSLSRAERVAYIQGVKNGTAGRLYSEYMLRPYAGAAEYMAEWYGNSTTPNRQSMLRNVMQSFRKVEGIGEAYRIRDKEYGRIKVFDNPFVEEVEVKEPDHFSLIGDDEKREDGLPF